VAVTGLTAPGPVLALRAAGIGDLLVAVPALRALAQVARSSQRGVAVAAPAWLADLVALLPGVSDHVIVAHDLTPMLAARPALAVNLHGRGPQSHQALLRLQPAALWAFAVAGLHEDGPAWGDPDEPERRRWVRLLRWYGVPDGDGSTAIARPAVASPVPGSIIVHVGGKDAERRLTTVQAATLARGLRDVGRVVVTGGAADAARALRVAADAGLPAHHVLAGRLTLGEVAALVAQARLVVSGDTGIAHLGVAYQVPSVQVFGPVSPRRWGPPAGTGHVVLRASGAHPTAAAVPAGDVLAVAVEQLERAVSAGAA